MNILNFICIKVVVRTLAIALGTVGNPWAVAWVAAWRNLEVEHSPLAAAWRNHVAVHSP